MTLAMQLAMTPYGLAATACTLIGGAIGKQDVDEARRYFKMIMGFTLIYCFAM